MTDHQRELLTSVSISSSEADRKRLRKAEYPEVEKMLVNVITFCMSRTRADFLGLSYRCCVA